MKILIIQVLQDTLIKYKLKTLQNDDDKLAEALLYANSIEQTIDKVSNFEKVDEESK